MQDTLEEREADDAEDGEAADLGYPDDAANIKAFEAARERQGISKGVGAALCTGTQN